MTPIRIMFALTYRVWAGSELVSQNLAEAGELLESAYGEWMQVAPATGIVWSHELINVVYNWGYLGAAYFNAREKAANSPEKGRLAFQQAHKVLDSLSGKSGVNNDYTTDARGITFQSWGQHEYLAGFQQDGHQLLEQSEQQFQQLSDKFAWKNFRLAELKQVQSQMARGEAQLKPSPESLPTDLSSQPKRTPAVMYGDQESNIKSSTRL